MTDQTTDTTPTPAEDGALRDDPTIASEPEPEVEAETVSEVVTPVAPEPEPRPAPTTTPEPAAPRRGGSVFLGMVLGAALAVGAGYGVQRYLVPQPVFDPAPLGARLTAAEAEAAGLRAEIARLSEAVSAPAPSAAPDPAVLDRLAALETRAVPEAPPLEPLTARVDQLEANLAALAVLPSETGVSPAALAALQAEVAALKSQRSDVSAEISATAAAVETRLAEAEARASDIARQAEAIATAAARTAALGQIDAALDSGLPYRAALAVLSEAEVPSALAAHADTGLPTIAALRDAFPEAARLALEQALRANTGDSWTERVATFLRNQTGARSLAPRAGNDPDAVLSRAEAALAGADLPAAMSELAALPASAQTALAEWVSMARIRLDAQAAFADLMQAAGQ